MSEQLAMMPFSITALGMLWTPKRQQTVAEASSITSHAQMNAEATQACGKAIQSIALTASLIRFLAELESLQNAAQAVDRAGRALSTRLLDKCVCGRMFFEQVIRKNLVLFSRLPDGFIDFHPR